MSREDRPAAPEVSLAGAPTGAPPAARRLRLGHRSDIEGLRAVAVLLVVAFHAGLGVLPGGYVGVDVFFVLSGYLITGLLADELLETGSVSFARFYGRRARRLLPMATVVLLATGVGFAFVLSPLDRSGLVDDIRSAALYFANWHFAADSLDYMSAVDKSPVLHYWSLSVEEQFYVIWPLLLVLVTRRRRAGAAGHPLGRMAVTLAVLGAASLAASVLVTPVSAPFAYYGLHTRGWELAAGGLLALAARPVGRLPVLVRGAAGWLGLAGIVASAVVLSRSTAFPGWVAVLPVGSTMLVVAAGRPGARSGVARLLSVAPLTYVGRISYAWYLWHWPCLIFAGVVAGGRGLADAGGGVIASPAQGWPALAAVALSLLLSAVSYRFYENPVRRSRWLAAVRHRSLVLGAGLTTVTVTVVGFVLPLGAAADAGYVEAVTAPAPTATAGAISATTPTASPTPAARRVKLKQSPQEARNDEPGTNPGCRINTTDTRPGTNCQFGDPDGDVKVALIGDSHAHMWLPALKAIAKQRHWQLYMWEKPSCPMIRLTVRLPAFHDDYPSCATYHDNVLREMQRRGPFDAAVVTNFTGYPRHLGTAANKPLTYAQAIKAWGPAWRSMSKELLQLARTVVVIHDDPRSPRDVPACLAAHPHDARPCSFARGPALVDSNAVFDAERAAAASTTSFVTMNDVICPRPVCPVIWSDGTIMYRDAHHLTASLVRELAPILQRRLVPIVEPRGHNSR